MLTKWVNKIKNKKTISSPLSMPDRITDTDHIIMVDICAKFFKYLRIEGWVSSDFETDTKKDQLSGIFLTSAKINHYEGKINLPSPGLGKNLNKSFVIDVYLTTELFPEDAILIIKFKTGLVIKRNLMEISKERLRRYKSLSVMSNFQALIGNGSVLDIGGRARSKLDRSQLMSNKVCVFDVLDGENVDVVGDAHHLSDFLALKSFDAAMSICVFEHLAMPWKVVGEINKILKTGGYILIYTHQTIGLHDSPWDFFRFSEDTWPVMLNEKTGFKIIDRGSDFEQFIIPFIYHAGKKDAEKSAGREASWVIAQKITDVCLEYPLCVSDFTETFYPDIEDANNPDHILI